jgi:hypothetical protein
MIKLLRGTCAAWLQLRARELRFRQRLFAAYSVASYPFVPGMPREERGPLG